MKKTLAALTMTAACVGAVLVGAPSQAASHHGTRNVHSSEVQVQFKQFTYTRPTDGELFCATFFRTRTSNAQAWETRPWQIGPVAEGACGTQVH